MKTKIIIFLLFLLSYQSKGNTEPTLILLGHKEGVNICKFSNDGKTLLSGSKDGIIKGLIFFVIGGFLVGFGTRYAGGCTSGHSIMGLSSLQLPSLIATIAFMVGGFISANLIIPILFNLINN